MLNWKWIGILSVASGISSLATVFGVMPEGVLQYVLSFALSILFAYLLVRVIDSKFFLNGLMMGLGAGIAGTLVQMLLFDIMIANNPQMAQRFEQMPGNMNPVVAMAMFAPIGIVFSGLIMGLFTWIVAMLMGKGRRRRVVPPPV